VGTGDLTAALVPADRDARATVITREPAVVCGRPWFDEVFRQIDPRVDIEWQADEGDFVDAGALLCRISGSARALLSGERAALNFLQTLSGTATTVRRWVEVVAGTRRDDIVAPPWRYFQYDYSVRLLSEGFFGQDIAIPSLNVTYNIQAAAGNGAQGRDQTYVLPPLPVRVAMLVPKDAADIRDSSNDGFAAIATRRGRATNATVALDLTEHKIPPGTHSFYLQTQTPGKYRNNPEAAKAAEEALKQAEKSVADLAAAIKTTAEAKQAATKAAGDSAARAKVASEAVAEPAKAADAAEALAKAAAEKLAGAKTALEAKPDDPELIAAKEAAADTEAVDELLEGVEAEVIKPSRNGDRFDAIRETLDTLQRRGYGRLLVDGRAVPFDEVDRAALKDRTTLDVIVDRLKIEGDLRSRLTDSIETSYREGGGAAFAVVLGGNQGSGIRDQKPADVLDPRSPIPDPYLTAMKEAVWCESYTFSSQRWR